MPTVTELKSEIELRAGAIAVRSPIEPGHPLGPQSTVPGFPAICTGMFQRTDDLRIRQVRPLIPPAILHEEIPISEKASNVVAASRAAIASALKGHDARLVVIAGPCSIHDTTAALEYGERL